MSWFDKQDLETMDLVRKVSDFDQWEVERYEYDKRRFDALKAQALDTAGLSEADIEPVDLDEDQNRSDGETAFFFFTATEALQVFRMALELGLAEGEVVYDDTVDPRYGVGGYAVRMAPHVAATKPLLMLDLAREMYEFVLPEDHNEYVDWHNQLIEVTASEKKGLKKLAKKPRKDTYREYNPIHGAPSGKFASKEQVKSAGKGSYSHLDTKRKVGKSKKGGFQMQMTKNPCGRAARGGSNPKYTRCHDGKPGYPWPSSDVSPARRKKG